MASALAALTQALAQNVSTTTSPSNYGGYFPSTFGGSTAAGTGLTFPWPPPTPEPPRPVLRVVRICCFKCAKDDGKFLLEVENPFYSYSAMMWCEECYMVRQLGGPPEATK